MLTIGFAGYAGCGKDTAAKAIVPEEYIVEASRDVKRGLLAIDPWVNGWRLSYLIEKLGWDVAKERREVRRLLQTYGTEAGRDIHGDDCWVKKLRFTLDDFQRRAVTMAAVTGIRFANEVSLVNKLIWIDRPGRGEGDHVSEQLGQIKAMADVVIVNNGTVDDLAKKVRAVV